MKDHYDVIVVGARCAGSATAMLLARNGLRVLVLDRSRYGSDTVSTHALMRGGVLQLLRWGVLDRIVAAGTPPVRRAVFHYPGEDATRISIKPAAGVDALYAPRRTVLDAALADSAVEAGAEVRFGTTVTELIRDRSGRVSGVEAIDRTGRRHSATAALVVGADGVRSTVAAAVGAPVSRTAKRPGGAFVYGYWDELPAEGFEWLYAPSASAGLIPTNDGQTLVFTGTTAARLVAMRKAHSASEVVAALLAEISPDVAARVADARRPRRLRGFAGQRGYLRRPSGPGWALVGDAGGFQDPLSPHGITDAFRDAELLARAVTSIRDGTATESAAMEGYWTARDTLAGRLFDAVEHVGSYEWTMAELRGLLLDVSSAMSEQVEAMQRFDPVISGR